MATTATAVGHLFLTAVQEGRLEVTAEGRVRNVRTGRWIGESPKQRYGHNTLTFSGQERSCSVHKLVYLVYNGPSIRRRCDISTTDIPGSNPANGDHLQMGCWAEHQDGSRLFIEGTEGGLVTYSMFDMARRPVVEYRDRMGEQAFRARFAPAGAGLVWTWHDKTPFPWDEVIREGAQPGARLAGAADQVTLAQRVAESLHLRAREVLTPELKARQQAFTQLEQQHPTVAAALEAFLQSLTQLPTDAPGRAPGTPPVAPP